jgi:protein gp37
MSDLHGDGVDGRWIAGTIDAMRAAPQHTYQLLTKHPERYFLDSWWDGLSVWLGATATNQESWDHACEHLSKLPSGVVRWISAEPMLGTIKPDDWMPDWVVVGALSGHGNRKKEESAAKGIGLSGRLQFQGVQVFEKDSLGYDPTSATLSKHESQT